MKFLTKSLFLLVALSSTGLKGIPAVPIVQAKERVARYNRVTEALLEDIRNFNSLAQQRQAVVLTAARLQLHRINVEKRTMDAYLYVKLAHQLAVSERRLQKALRRLAEQN